jgi:molybdopterin-guanine dinucleotide biosynthesis protein A
MTTRYDAVVAAGGAARRLGGTDKPAVSVGGHMLLDRVLAACVDARESVVVGPRRPTARPVRWAHEEPPGGGPLPALAAGLAALDGDSGRDGTDDRDGLLGSGGGDGSHRAGGGDGSEAAGLAALDAGSGPGGTYDREGSDGADGMDGGDGSGTAGLAALDAGSGPGGTYDREGLLGADGADGAGASGGTGGMDSPEVVVVLAADLPFLTADTVSALVGALTSGEGAAAEGVMLIDPGGRDQPLAAAYRTGPLRRELARLTAEHGALTGLPLRLLTRGLDLRRIADPTGEASFDCDTWEDVAAARARLESAP